MMMMMMMMEKGKGKEEGLMAQSHCGTSLPSASTQGRNDTSPAHTYIPSHDADHKRYKNKAAYSKKSVPLLQCKDE